MIDIEQPAMGLNSASAPARVQMWNTWKVPENKAAADIVEWVRSVALSAPGGKLKNVIFNCHGLPGQIVIGKGIDMASTPLFARWVEGGRGLVEKIWLHGCRSAYITPATGSRGIAGGGDGNLFCSALARAAKAYVVASTETQFATAGRILPFGKLDSFEGLVLSYGPVGNVTWSHRYPSLWEDSDGNWHQNPD